VYSTCPAALITNQVPAIAAANSPMGAKIHPNQELFLAMFPAILEKTL
jgi:hypothetical protein